jgi:hypothetical protein
MRRSIPGSIWSRGYQKTPLSRRDIVRTRALIDLLRQINRLHQNRCDDRDLAKAIEGLRELRKALRPTVRGSRGESQVQRSLSPLGYEGEGGYTVVNGERVPMYPGDLVLTPNCSWHDHHVVEGAGYSVVGGQRLDWEDKDVFTVWTWTFYEHVNGDRPAFLFSFSDAPVMKALSLYRDETRA